MGDSITIDLVCISVIFPDMKKMNYKRKSHDRQKESREGVLSLHQDGYGFVIAEKPGDDDVFVPARFIGEALHKDRVLVEITKRSGGKRCEGVIVKVIEHGMKYMTGRFECKGKNFCVIAEDRRVRYSIKVVKGGENGARCNDDVIVRIVTYPGSKHGLTGEVYKILDNRGTIESEIEVIKAKYDLPQIFYDDVINEAKNQKIDFEDYRGRKDLRKINFVTIDGASARDFDDAIAVEKVSGEEFLYRLYVSIADVSHFVRPSTAIDREAYQRGTSVYFPSHCIPMLPEELSNELCSLKPNEDRLTLTCQMDIDEDGNIIDHDVYESIINSKARLTYKEVAASCHREESAVGGRRGDLHGTIEDRGLPRSSQSSELAMTTGDGGLPRPSQGSGLAMTMMDDMSLMFYVADLLNKKRMQRGSIDFDLPEPEIILNIQGGVDAIVKSERNRAHMMIEDFMIAANETIAEHLTKKNIGCIYRVHGSPDGDKITAFMELIHNFGYKADFKGSVSPKQLSNVLKGFKNKNEEKLVNMILLRSLAQAVYHPKNIGHFGLASKCYCHFTSPIRRYPDLVVHRLLKSIVCHPERAKRREGSRVHTRDSSSAPSGLRMTHLQEIAEHSSIRERVAMKAEREINDLYKAAFMEDKVGEQFEGSISGVTKFGIFVKLDEYFVEGLVHIDNLPPDNYYFDEKHLELTAKKGKIKYRLGDKLKVEVESVSVTNRKIDFILLDAKS